MTPEDRKIGVIMILSNSLWYCVDSGQPIASYYIDYDNACGLAKELLVVLLKTSIACLELEMENLDKIMGTDR